MTLSESEKEKIIDIVGRLTDEYRKTFNVKIFTVRNVNGTLALIMGDEYIKVGITYTLQDFEDIGYYIMRNYPGDLAFYFGIYWQSQLKHLHSIYSIKLRQKALKILDSH